MRRDVCSLLHAFLVRRLCSLCVCCVVRCDCAPSSYLSRPLPVLPVRCLRFDVLVVDVVVSRHYSSLRCVAVSRRNVLSRPTRPVAHAVNIDGCRPVVLRGRHRIVATASARARQLDGGSSAASFVRRWRSGTGTGGTRRVACMAQGGALLAVARSCSSFIRSVVFEGPPLRFWRAAPPSPRVEREVCLRRVERHVLRHDTFTHAAHQRLCMVWRRALVVCSLLHASSVRLSCRVVSLAVM